MVAYRSKVVNQNFSNRAAKMGKKYWRETFGNIGAKFQRKILSPGQSFQILPIWYEVPGSRRFGALYTSGA